MHARSADGSGREDWRARLTAFRSHPLLRRNAENPERVKAFLRSLSDITLQVAADLPSHSGAARSLAHDEMARRGLGPASPLSIPGFVTSDNFERALQDIAGWKSFVRRRGVLAIHAAFVVSIGLVIAAVLSAILICRSPLLEQLALGSFAVLLPIVAGVVALITGLFTWFRQLPFRVLFLRKFNSNRLGRVYRKVLNRDLAPFGHVIALSDRTVRRSTMRWIGDILDPYMKSFSGGLFVGLIGIVGAIIIVFPLMLVLRAFDPTRWGPAHVASAREFRLFARRLTDRIELNGETTSEASGYLVRTSDDWWKHVAELLIRSADMIVLDVSDVTSGTEWEIARLETLALWDRVVPIVRAEQKPNHALLSVVPREVLDRAHAYDARGCFQDRDAFYAAMTRAASASINKH